LEPSLDLGKVVDDCRIGRFQLLILALCFSTMIIDGYDAQSAAFVAPLLSAAWGVSNVSLSPAFAMGLLGMAIGAMLFGAISDRFGRKVIIVSCLVAFGVLNIAKAYASSVPALTVLQFVAGLGVGGAMPNVIALMAEYSPARRRALFVTLAAAGYALGAAGAGLVTASLSSRYGWQATFIVGGLAPLLLVPFLVWLLPDSIRFMVLSGRSTAKINRLLRLIDPTLQVHSKVTLTLREEKLVGSRLSHLFREGRAGMTLFLWMAIFMDLLVIYFMSTWLVVTVHSVGGIPIQDAAVAASIFSGAGLFGTPVIGQLMDRIGHARMLGLSFFIASCCIALSGNFVSSLFIFRLLLFIAGFFLIGAHLGINAFSSAIYPAFMRATGVGWALGIGRMGSAMSPILGGVLLSWNWQLPSVFIAVATPALLASICVLLAGQFASRSEIQLTSTNLRLGLPPDLASQPSSITR
jgi:AAHS family 4-hydroxybenzoate transporter-like MFS transporter